MLAKAGAGAVHEEEPEFAPASVRLIDHSEVSVTTFGCLDQFAKVK